MQKFSYVGKYADGGSQNSFYRLKGKSYGFKSFPNKSMATFARSVQEDLSKYNLAPRVHSPVCKIRVPNYFAVSDGRGGMKTVTKMVLSDWGYLTEIAKPFCCQTKVSETSDSEEYCDGDCANNSCCIHYNSICNLLDSIESFGLEYNDAHPANLGYVKRGKNKFLVVIDLGAESVMDVEGNYPDVCWDGAEDTYCDCHQCCGRYDYA